MQRSLTSIQRGSLVVQNWTRLCACERWFTDLTHLVSSFLPRLEWDTASDHIAVNGNVTFLTPSTARVEILPESQRYWTIFASEHLDLTRGEDYCWEVVVDSSFETEKLS